MQENKSKYPFFLFIPRYEKFSESGIAGTHEELLEALSCVKEDRPANAGILSN